MSNPVTKLIKKKFPKNKNTSINDSQSSKNKSNINKNFINFIKSVKFSNPDGKGINPKKKSLSENIYDSLMSQKEEKNYLEENDKEIKLGAQKGLLYLLNELSNGKFFPDINDFFDKMKYIKLEELRMQSKSPNKNIINEYEDKKSTKEIKKGNSQSKKKLVYKSLVQLSEIKNEEDNENKSVNKKRKILKGKTYNKTKKNIKFSSKSPSKKNLKENINTTETNG